MSCGMLLLFTNVTREPTDTVTERGDTPLDVMVIVAPVVGVGSGVGVGVVVGSGVVVGAGAGVGVGELGVELLCSPAQDATANRSAIARHREVADLMCIRNTSLKYGIRGSSRLLPPRGMISATG